MLGLLGHILIITPIHLFIMNGYTRRHLLFIIKLPFKIFINVATTFDALIVTLVQTNSNYLQNNNTSCTHFSYNVESTFDALKLYMQICQMSQVLKKLINHNKSS